MVNSNELGEFLKASRARLRPEDIGLSRTLRHSAVGASRRVVGLRREEVAGLSGVSVDYYARLEQGRTKQVGHAVLAAIADTLKLTSVEREYFYTLVSAQTVTPKTLPEETVQRVRPGMHQLLESLTGSPAFVLGRGMAILAMNPLAKAVLFDPGDLPSRDRNLARWTFLNPESRNRYVDWQTVADDAAAILRIDVTAYPNDRALTELIGELTVKSEAFQKAWAAHKVHECTYGRKRLRHPGVGRIDVEFEALDVPGATDQKLFVYTASSGSPSADALRLLANWPEILKPKVTEGTPLTLSP